VVGGWAQRASGEVVCRLLEDLGADETAAIAREAATLESWLGAGRVTPRFRTPLERELSGRGLGLVLWCTLAYILGVAVMTVSEARAALPEVLNRVAEGEEVTITRHGRAVAVIVRPDVVWSRSRAEVVLNDAAQMHALLESVADADLNAGGGITEQYAEELIASIRAGRDSR
jgi:antitoxin (DNA-binding transcriptional repressor) of toxin-antitoxin stability system